MAQSVLRFVRMPDAADELKTGIAPHMNRFKMDIAELTLEHAEQAKLRVSLDMLERDIFDCIERHADYYAEELPGESGLQTQLLGLVDAFQAEFRRTFTQTRTVDLARRPWRRCGRVELRHVRASAADALPGECVVGGQADLQAHQP